MGEREEEKAGAWLGHFHSSLRDCARDEPAKSPRGSAKTVKAGRRNESFSVPLSLPATSPTSFLVVGGSKGEKIRAAGLSPEKVGDCAHANG